MTNKDYSEFSKQFKSQCRRLLAINTTWLHQVDSLYRSTQDEVYLDSYAYLQVAQLYFDDQVKLNSQFYSSLNFNECT